MADVPNFTPIQSDKGSDFVAIPFDQLNFTQQSMVKFKALNGLLTDDDGNLDRHSIERFANEKLGITKRGAIAAMKSVPNFWDLVADQRKLLASQARLNKVHDVWYLSALKPGNEGFRDRQTYLANFDPQYRMPTQKVEHEAGNSWAALLTRKADNNVIEGEVVDGS